MALLPKLRHPNVVQFLGSVTLSKPLMLVTEYLTGVRGVGGNGRAGGAGIPGAVGMDAEDKYKNMSIEAGLFFFHIR